MNRKYGKWMMAAVIVLFFLAGGIWYVLSERAVKEEQSEQNGLTGVLEVTPAVGVEELPEASVTTLPGPIQLEERILVVFVCGAVKTPGVYELKENSRLYEAVELAGGFTEEADTSYHNLARTVADGERIYILTREETKELTIKERVNGEPSSGVWEQEAGLGSTEEQRINLNTATVEQLTTLPGIGEAKAESILEYRTKVGRFTAIEEVMNISGIGEAMFEKIKDRITVE